MGHYARIICAGIMASVLPAGGLAGCAGTEGPDNLIRTSPIVTTVDMPLCESTAGQGEIAGAISAPPEVTDGGDLPDDNGVMHHRPDEPPADPDDEPAEERREDDVDGSPDDEEKPQGDDASREESPGEETPEPAGDSADLSSIVSVEMMRDSFRHGPLPADKVRYVVLHDTESGTDDAEAIARSWGDGHIASHFVVAKDGRVVQCVPIDQIAHHAGNADPGSNDRYGISPERDDEVGRTGSGDYAMNAWSIGIEIVHEHDEGAYPEAQLEAVDRLIAAIDQAVGHRPDIIDHKAWAGSRKQDVSDDFPLGAYQRDRRHAD